MPHMASARFARDAPSSRLPLTQRAASRVKAGVLLVVALVVGLFQDARAALLAPLQRQGLRNDVNAFSEFGGILAGLGVAFLIIGAVITAIIVANLTPTYGGAIGNSSKAIATTDFGNPTANALRAPMSLIVSVVGLVGIVLASIAAIVIKKD